MPRPSRSELYPIRPPGGTLTAGSIVPSSAPPLNSAATVTSNLQTQVDTIDHTTGPTADLSIALQEGYYYQFLIRVYAVSAFHSTNGPMWKLFQVVAAVDSGVATIVNQQTIDSYAPGGSVWTMTITASGANLNAHFDSTTDTNDRIAFNGWFEYTQLPGLPI